MGKHFVFLFVQTLRFSSGFMLPKEVDWSVLAQCDYFAVEQLVQTDDRIAMSTVEPMRRTIFERKLSKDIKWKDTFEKMCAAYRKLEPNFSIEHDKFGGYRLVYKGKSLVRSSTLFKGNPIGFIKEVPEGVVTDLSIMSSERTGKQLLLLGPMRFVNSDCEPNCEYDFTSDAGIIQLRAKKRINTGDEILVKYGPDFFEFNSCLCRTCELNTREVNQNVVFDLLLSDIIVYLTSEIIEEIRLNQRTESQEKPCRPKERRIRGKELVEFYNNLTRSPLSSCDSPERNERSSMNANSPSSTPGLLSENSTHEQSEEDEFSSCTTLSCDTNKESSFLLLSDVTDTDAENINQNQPADNVGRASSPFAETATLCFSLSEIGQNESLQNEFSSPSESHDEKLFDGSEVSVDDATFLTQLFCSKFRLSDECSHSLHALINALLPSTNNFPSGYSHISGVKNNFNRMVRNIKKSSEFSVCVLRFRIQLRDIVKCYFNEINHYSAIRKNNPEKDFNHSLCPPVNVNNKNHLVINLVLFSDGVNIKKSTLKKEVWPIWIQIADLPPRIRMARKNIVLAALYVGNRHPDWKDLVPELKNEILMGIEIEFAEQVMYIVEFKVRLLISDLGAKSHMLNMFNFNGFYGCHFCNVPGKTIGRTHAYYPYIEQGELRETSLNDLYVDIAELQKKDMPNVVGVKGKSAFSNIINGLPLTAPIDYMHCVLLGVFPELLKLCYKTLSPQLRSEICTITANSSCPREMVCFSGKIRSLEEISQFKANEHFNWLFYISPIVFYKRIPEFLYQHLSNLVFGVRLLLESSSDENCSQAEKLLDEFCKEIVTVHAGNPRIETINVHCIRHLANQVKKFGPLFCQSAMCFEAANRTLGEVFSGSTSECEIICRRVLQRHELRGKNIKSEKLKSLFGKFSENVLYSDEKNFSNEFVETNAVKDGRSQYKGASFFNRVIVRNRYFDSAAYKRSKQGNCFVRYIDAQDEKMGEIQYFLQIPGSPFFSETLAVIRHFRCVEDIGVAKGFIFRVVSSSEENIVPVKNLQKIFFMKIASNCNQTSAEDCFVVKLTSFEHS